MYLNSDGKFKKILFDDDMIKTNRIFTILKLKNNIKIVDSFISNAEGNLIILTSIGRVFKYSLSNQYISPTTKHSQGLILTKLLPGEKIVSCCESRIGENIYLVSKKGKFIYFNDNEIFYDNKSFLGYLNEKAQLRNDSFIKILPENSFLDIETNKNKSARLNFKKINLRSKKTLISIDFLKLEKDEYLKNCFRMRTI